MTCHLGLGERSAGLTDLCQRGIDVGAAVFLPGGADFVGLGQVSRFEQFEDGVERHGQRADGKVHEAFSFEQVQYQQGTIGLQQAAQLGEDAFERKMMQGGDGRDAAEAARGEVVVQHVRDLKVDVGELARAFARDLDHARREVEGQHTPIAAGQQAGESTRAAADLQRIRLAGGGQMLEQEGVVVAVVVPAFV